MSEQEGIKTNKENFGEWYLEIVRKCDIIDQRYPVKGFPVYMPWAMFIIKQMYIAYENKLEKTGHMPVTFPVVIPKNNLTKEKEHVKGFENEVFWVTHAGKNELEEPLFLRPTSETAIYPMYALWVRSHKDLPLKAYQSVQVYRYETKMTKPLMRGREFFWIETHTVQKTMDLASKQVIEDMEITQSVLDDYLTVPFMTFERPSWDKFPGAEYTYAYDVLMPDNYLLQVATTHNLGQKFAKAFDIMYENENGEKVYAYQTCFGPGISRHLAALISVHGDNSGLILPPNIAPVQIVIIPVYIKGHEDSVRKKCIELEKKLCDNYRVKFDDRDHRTGYKLSEWEMKGVPIRIEIGPKDLEQKKITISRRDNKQKMQINESDFNAIDKLMNEMLSDLKEKANKTIEENIRSAKTMKELQEIIEKKGGFVKVSFCSIDKDGEKCAEIIEKEMHAKVRGIKFGAQETPVKCVVCSKDAKHVVYVAKAY